MQHDGRFVTWIPACLPVHAVAVANFQDAVLVRFDRWIQLGHDVQTRISSGRYASAGGRNREQQLRCPRMLLGGCCSGNYFTSTSMRIQGWMQHWNRCLPFDRPMTSRRLP